MELTYQKDANGFLKIRNMDIDRTLVATMSIHETEETARRIVACVNALEGVEIEELEKWGIAFLGHRTVAAMNHVAQVEKLNDEWAAEANAAHAQNVRLLEALKEFVELNERGGIAEEWEKIQSTAHAAITEAENTEPDDHTKATIL